MEIVVVSDTHGDFDFIEKIVSKHPEAEYYLHSGDVCLNNYDISPFIAVRGNCDYNISNLTRVIRLGEHQIFMFHGDSFILTLNNLVELAKSNCCDIIIHGHIHKSYYEEIDGVHIISPGSLTKPRGGYPSYAVININNSIVKVDILKYEY